MRLVLLGPPGSGKGTQAALLKDRLNIVHISTGDLLRAAVAAGTELGKIAKATMDAGELVSDELVLQLLEDRLNEPDVANGYILDGYPRNLAQAQALDELLARLNQNIDHALALIVDEEQIVARLAQRAAEQGRSDDSESVVRHRLHVYAEQTAPVVNYYEDKGILTAIDGMGSIDEINQRLCDAI
ncbi:MAG TPA: adenylate kinase [Wenzhouxiangella sp.]